MVDMMAASTDESMVESTALMSVALMDVSMVHMMVCLMVDMMV